MAKVIETENDAIKKALSDMGLYKNPELLENIRKTIKKNVPMGMRGNFLAYLYVSSQYYKGDGTDVKKRQGRAGVSGAERGEAEHSLHSDRRDAKNGRDTQGVQRGLRAEGQHFVSAKSEDESRTAANFDTRRDTDTDERPQRSFPSPRVQSEGTTSIYVNVGRISRISPASIIQFIANGSGLKDSDILSLTYRQNYSFLTVKTENARQVVEKMNGAELKGRKLRVNYAKDQGESSQASEH